jgi:prophage regulatory protein
MLRRRDVLRRTGLSRSTIYAYIAAKQFPSPIPLGPRAVGWVEDEINAWIEERIRIAREG